MITSLIGAFGGGAVGRMLGGRTGGMIGSMAGSMLSRNMGSGGGLGSLLGGLMGGNAEPAPPSVMDDTEALVLIRAMCAAAKADGRVDQNEIDAIVERAGDLDDEDEVMLRAELQNPPAMADLVAQVPRGLEAEVYAASLLPIDVDTASEVTYLQELSRALGLSGSQTAAIHEELGLR